MFSRVRGVGGFPFAAMALAVGIWGLSGRSAMAQGGLGGGVGAGIDGGPAYGVSGVPAGSYVAPPGGAGYRGTVYGGYGPGNGTFGLGYPGYGLDYVHGCAAGYHHRHFGREITLRSWCSDVLGKECLYPYVADPYSDPRAALGFWPPYSAPSR